MKRKIITVLIIGILIRLFLAFSTFHVDLRAFYFAGEVIAKGNVLNFYDYLRNLPATDPILKIYPPDLFIYPPLVYFSLCPIIHLASLPFSHDLLHNFIFNLPSLLGNLQFNFFLLAIKLPYLLFDIGIAVLFFKLFRKPTNKFIAFTIWMFNPINLYATYMVGQFDVIPTFFAVLALYLAVKKNKYFLSAFFLGLGASFKIFPFLFLVPVALMTNKWWSRIKILGIGALTYIATVLPFIGSHGFRATALLAGQTTKSLYAAIPVSGGESIILFPLFVLFLYIVFFYSRSRLENLWKSFFVLILLFFVFTHTHPQWSLWLTPFLIIDLVKSRLSHWPLVVLLLIVWIGQVTFFDPGLSVWLFSPIVPALYGQSGIWTSLGINLDINFARSILQTIFVSVAAYYIYCYLPKKSDQT